MPQNVVAAVLGEGEYLAPLVRAILEKDILPAGNVALPAKNVVAAKAAEGYKVCMCEDGPAAVLRSEIVLVCGSYKDMPVILAPIATVVGQRVLVTVSEDPRINIDFVRDRVVNGTEIITATIHRAEDGRLSVSYDIARNVRLFLHQTCRDLVNAML